MPTILYRPTLTADVDTPEGGATHHYRTIDGRRLDPAAFLYQHPDVPGLEGWFGQADDMIVPDGYFPPGPASFADVLARTDAVMIGLGFDVRDRPVGWCPPITEQRLTYGRAS